MCSELQLCSVLQVWCELPAVSASWSRLVANWSRGEHPPSSPPHRHVRATYNHFPLPGFRVTMAVVAGLCTDMLSNNENHNQNPSRLVTPTVTPINWWHLRKPQQTVTPMETPENWWQLWKKTLPNTSCDWYFNRNQNICEIWKTNVCNSFMEIKIPQKFSDHNKNEIGTKTHTQTDRTTRKSSRVKDVTSQARPAQPPAQPREFSLRRLWELIFQMHLIRRSSSSEHNTTSINNFQLLYPTNTTLWSFPTEFRRVVVFGNAKGIQEGPLPFR